MCFVCHKFQMEYRFGDKDKKNMLYTRIHHTATGMECSWKWTLLCAEGESPTDALALEFCFFNCVICHSTCSLGQCS